MAQTTDRQTVIATYRVNQPRGQLSEREKIVVKLLNLYMYRRSWTARIIRELKLTSNLLLASLWDETASPA